MKYIFANWKMYLDFDESNILANALLQEKNDFEKINLAIFPTILAFREVQMGLEGSKINTGAQDIFWEPKGGYTSGVSAEMFKKLGCQYALVGHSERRHIFGDSNEVVRKKLEACLDVGLTPILCIGETKKEREENKRDYRLKKQLLTALEKLDLENKEIIVAYEPVWAIGTGESCDPLEAEEVHNWIKNELKTFSSKEIPLLYGGSVKAENVLSYISLNSIDGVLVGGASTKLETFLPLIKAVENK